MAKKPKKTFLYLAIACFAGLVTIFVVDGYMGIHDTIRVTVGEYEREVEADYWADGDDYWPVSADAGDNVYFSYQIDNNQLSEYSTHIQASLWQENEKIIDLFSEDVSIARFDEIEMEWALLSESLPEYVRADGYEVYSEEYSVKIARGDVERRVIVNYYYYGEGVPPFKPMPER